MANQKVQVYIYDLSKGLARSMSMAFLGKQLDGIWHTGIVAYGQEFYYGGMGIEGCSPGGTILGQPDTMHDLGDTEIPFEIFMDYLQDLASTSFKPECYHLLNHNCNTFSNELAQFLTGSPVPAHITNLPQEVLNTPFGAMIKPFIDAMSVSPQGGSQIFSSTQTPPAVQPPPPAPVNHSSKPGESATTSDTKANQPKGAAGKATNEKGTGTSVNNAGRFKPVTHKMKMPEIELLQAITSSLLEKKTKDLLLEIHEYISTPDCSWSLGRPHIECASSLLSHESANNLAAVLLAEAIKSKDVIQVVSTDPQKQLLLVSSRLESMTTEQQAGYTKVLCNMCASTKGRDHLQSSVEWKCGDRLVTNLSVVTKTCVQGILSDNNALQAMASSLALNLTISDLPADTAVELGGAIIQHLAETDVTLTQPDIVYCCLAALYICMETSSEVAALAGVMGLDVTKFKGLSEKTSELCNLITQKIKHM